MHVSLSASTPSPAWGGSASEYFSRHHGTQVSLIRLNYAVELRYGVLFDIAQSIMHERAIDRRMGHFNLIWQGEANACSLQALSIAASPPWSSTHERCCA